MPPPPTTRATSKEPRPFGLRLVLRAMLYARERHGFGCDKDPCDCRRHLRLDIPDTFDARFIPRVKHITRLESLINIGCKFGPNDLEPDQWRDLVILATERQWIQQRVQEFRDTLRGQDANVADAQKAVRQAAGLPAPGQSLFSGGADGPKRSSPPRRAAPKRR